MSNLPPPVASPHEAREPDESQEIIYYEGSPKVRGELALLGITLVVFLVLALITWLLFKYVGTLAGIIGVVVALLALGFPILWVKRHKYRLTNTRIDTEEGILNIKNGTIWLWRVDDIQLNRTIIDRILGVGTITIISGDQTTPDLKLRSLPHPQDLFSELKRRVDVAKRQRGVVRMDGSVSPDLHTGHQHAQ